MEGIWVQTEATQPAGERRKRTSFDFYRFDSIRLNTN